MRSSCSIQRGTDRPGGDWYIFSRKQNIRTVSTFKLVPHNLHTTNHGVLDPRNQQSKVCWFSLVHCQMAVLEKEVSGAQPGISRAEV